MKVNLSIKWTVLAVLFFVCLVPFKQAFAADFILSGKVTDASSIPIENTSVSVVDTSTNNIVMTTSTNQTGNYNVSVPQGTYNITANPPTGSQFGSATAFSHTISSDTVINFFLVDASSVALSGHLYDSSGNPLSNQAISLSNTNGVSVVSTTDASGAYLVQVAPGTYTLRVSYVDTGNGPNSTSLHAPQNYALFVSGYSLTQSTVVDITLPTKQIVVHAQDASGSPVVNADVVAQQNNISVSLASLGNASGSSSYGSVFQAPKTDASGNVTLWLFAGSTTFTVYPPSESIYQTASLDSSIASDTQINITLPTSITLSGHLYDPSSNPLPNQTISLSNTSGVSVVSTTDAVGAYSIQIAPGIYTLKVAHVDTGNGPNSTSLHAPQNYAVFIPNYSLSQNTTEDITLPVKQVTVHVQDPSGSSVENAEVVSQQNNISVSLADFGSGSTSSDYGVTFSAPKTDASGNVTLWLFAGSTAFTVYPPSGSIYQTTSLNSTITTDAQVNITLLSSVTLSGHLYDPSGNPLPDQTISLSNTNGVSAVSTTDTAGNYLVQIAPGTYTLRVAHVDTGNGPNSTSLHAPQNYAVFVSGYSLTQNTVVDIMLPTKQVTVHIQNEGGNPIQNADVVAQQNNITVPIASLGTSSASTDYGVTFSAPKTDASGNVTLWLFAGSTAFTVYPSSGSIYQTASLNTSIDSDQTEIISLVSNNPPIITTTSLPEGTITASYSQSISVSNGSSPYSWSISSGTLPPGLTLNNSTGVLSGIPTTTGGYDFTVRVIDNYSSVATQDLTIIINSVPAISTTSLADATVSGNYTSILHSTGGTTPLTWSISSGNLPNGLSLNSSSGVISGIATTTGTFTFVARVNDAYGITASKSLTILVNAAPIITRNNLPNKKVNKNYSQSVTVSGGTMPLSWSLTNGVLPTGLALDSSTGIISGIPTVVGVYNFTIQVLDANNVSTTKALTIEITSK